MVAPERRRTDLLQPHLRRLYHRLRHPERDPYRQGPARGAPCAEVGGRFFCLEFSQTDWPGFKDIYDLYSHKLVPQIGKAIANDEDSYRYLVESIRRFPDMPAEFEA